MLRRLVAVPVLLFAVLALPTLAQARAPKPFGHSCQHRLGVRFCPTTTLAKRVSSFDGASLDVDVTLPARGSGPWPTIVMLHGYGGNKTNYEVAKRSRGFNNVGMAARGYAVVTYSARGFGRSCGLASSRVGKGCAKGWIRLADQRYEARDTQYLLGLLVDQGIAKRTALGVTGASYGGGQSLELAFLRNQIRLPNGRFAPWRSPKGKRLSLAAAYPVVPWSDLTSALEPNGRATGFANPVGVTISYVNALYLDGLLSGWVAPVGADPQADLTTWNNVTKAGEPFGAQARAIAAQLSQYHGAWSLINRKPTPLLMASGWTDDLFPPVQTLRVYDALRKRDPSAPVWLQYGDFGHPRGGAHANEQSAIADQGIAFFGHYLQGKKAAGLGAPGSVLAYGQTCPRTTPNGLGPFRARSFAALVGTKTTSLTTAQTQTVSSTGGDAALSSSLDPVFGKGGDACSTYPAAIAPGTAVAQATVSRATTYLGIGEITARIATTGSDGQLDARLWDVNGAQQTLVDRSVYRLTPNQSGTVTFALHGNGYRFAAGHTIQLELLGDDGPTHRPSNFPFTVAVSNLKVSLPTRG